MVIQVDLSIGAKDRKVHLMTLMLHRRIKTASIAARAITSHQAPCHLQTCTIRRIKTFQIMEGPHAVVGLEEDIPSALHTRMHDCEIVS
jgi:hypothetical protein